MNNPTVRVYGITLIELLVVLAVLAIFAVVAFPSFSSLFERNNLKGAGEQILQELYNAKFEAVRRNEPVHVSFAAGSAWCVGVGTEPTCDCGTAGSCDVSVRTAGDFPDVSASSPSSLVADSEDQFFEPVMGGFTGPASTCSPSSTPCQGSITLSHAQGGTLELQIYRMGRVRLCSPGTNFAGVPACQ